MKTKNKLLLIFILWAVSLVLILRSEGIFADDWSVGYIPAVWHMDDDYRCFDDRLDYNGSPHGLYVKYKALMIGRYENSKSGCDGTKYSTFVGLEAPLWSLGPVDFSVMSAIADGYSNDDDSDFGEYQPAASLNAQWKVLKVLYGYKVAAFALQWDFQ